MDAFTDGENGGIFDRILQRMDGKEEKVLERELAGNVPSVFDAF